MQFRLKLCLLIFSKNKKCRHIKVLNTPENDGELKKCQRTAYGFTNFGHFIARIRLHQMGTEAEKRRRQVQAPATA
ncbi:hypothetical protein NUU04_07400 [Limosilactobacillus fermentum]|uniref:hypothetical protein n=1 Tax=Limosilactobacillus fermentum TaxID=1613 RepID=UPI001F11E412|nr:hypothetical protein [Limosilactobacillus fermentum]UUY12774.1 hypothetical protein NUU04_07400 [Limosilactobacillus fermentum]